MSDLSASSFNISSIQGLEQVSPAGPLDILLIQLLICVTYSTIPIVFARVDPNSTSSCFKTTSSICKSPSIFNKNETDALLDEKVNEAVLDDYYTKVETYAKIEVYNQTEVEAFLEEKADIGNSYSKSEDDALLLAKADKTQLIDAYIKTEDDALLLAKADKTTTYTKTEDDALLLLKADKTQLIDSFTKTQDDALLALKLNIIDQIDAYSEAQNDALLLLKADRTELDKFINLQSAQTISGAKQFGVISATAISKLSKNDASILLAGGGDMLISSLFNQPQLQKVRDIATGRSRGYIFDTLDEMNNSMAIPDNVANLVIGDNLYIVDSQVTDQWWDGTQLRELETKQPDLTNVVTTLGTATGNGNAITDLSITGNIITPAKNITFVNTDYDQNISGSKLFTSTIHSYGINYQGYDNSSVFLAGGGVRSIADIQSNSYSKSEDDPLLLAKADKTQLIDSYSKSEADALLLLKVDKTQIIDAYIKTQDDTLLLAKADKTTTYTKIETYTKLDVKAEKTQIIDAYTKAQDDALLLLKADKTQIIDSYTKAQDDALLLLKADKSTTYDKTKIDEMIGNKFDNQTLVKLVNTTEDQIVNGNKIFTSNVNATGFAKTGKDNTSIVLAGGGDILLSSLQAGDVDLSNYYNKSETYVRDEVYTKTQDDALLLLKVDKTQLIDSYTKAQDDALLLAKADKTTTYTKNETNNLLDEKEDAGALYSREKIDDMMSFKVETTDLANYVTLGMSTVTETSFIKSGADDSVVLLGAGGTKPISEFVSGAPDLSNYYTKTQTYSKPETDNLFDDKMDSSELDNLVNKIQDQTVGGYKTFALNITAAGFAKTGKDDTSVLLAGGGYRLLSSFVGIEDLTSSAFSNMNSRVTSYCLIRIGNPYIFSLLAIGGSYNSGTFDIQYLVQNGTSTYTLFSFPNSTTERPAFVEISHTNGNIAVKSSNSTFIQCASATWVK
ncbi:MAG: hypothetical protein EZS28_022107 [Streblomastix strix]|uniref:Uncharacterized protein n=1 Tax=Streblomastix strix TaxID=222440 RepID=A0A5J4VIA1_9EUKA|nr:MAG: hypothetical protein EZS28_022107 [Streblomastix strix]